MRIAVYQMSWEWLGLGEWQSHREALGFGACMLRHCYGARVGVFGLCWCMQGEGVLQAREPLILFFRLSVGAFQMGAGSSPSSVVYSIQRPLKEGGVQSIFGGWGRRG